MTFTKKEKFLLIRGIAIQVYLDQQHTEFSSTSFKDVLYGLVYDLKVGITQKEMEEFHVEASKEQKEMTGLIANMVEETQMEKYR